MAVGHFECLSMHLCCRILQEGVAEKKASEYAKSRKWGSAVSAGRSRVPQNQGRFLQVKKKTSKPGHHQSHALDIMGFLLLWGAISGRVATRYIAAIFNSVQSQPFWGGGDCLQQNPGVTRV